MATFETCRHVPTLSVGDFGGYWWLPLPIFQSTTLITVNQPFANSCLVTQNQRGTKTGQNHGKIKSRHFARNIPCGKPLRLQSTNLFLEKRGEIPIPLIHNSFSYHCTPNVVFANGFDLKQRLLEDHRKANKDILTRHFYDMSNMMSRNEGVWLSNGWVKVFLWIFLPCFLYTVISIVYFVASYIDK